MKILKIILCLLLVISHNFIFGQKKKKVTFTPPKIKKVEFIDLYPNSKNPIYKILAKADKTTAFTWEIDKDTLLVKNSPFKEIVQFNSYNDRIDGGEIILNSTAEDFQMKKKNENDKEIWMTSFFSERKQYPIEFDKNIITFINDKKSIRKFRVKLDKSGTKILSLQDLDSKKYYYPSEPDYPSVSL